MPRCARVSTQPDVNAAHTGDDLIELVNGESFPYLKTFREAADYPDTLDDKIGEIFSEIANRFCSGYALRDALEIVDALNFGRQQAKHELSDLYETRIKRMRNAGRNGGEYYAPRPLIRAMRRDPTRDQRDHLRRRLRFGRIFVRSLGNAAPL